jgi:hypothetical protein
MQKYIKIFFVVLILLLLLFLACSSSEEGPYEEAQLVSFYSSDTCLTRMRQDGDSLEVEIEVDGFNINITHNNMMFNCCADSIRPEFTQSIDTLKITEVEFLTMPCDCVCPFEVNVTIRVAEPGSYLVQIFKYNVLIYQEWVEVL